MRAWFRSNGLLSIILLVAVALRFYRFWDIPYTHDELSALLRADVHSWTAFVASLVADSHPAVAQAVIVFTVKVFGYGHAAVKFPFLLAGVASVGLVYLIGQRLVSKGTGLLAAALLATAQYAITYNQWARPYSIGLFAVLLFFYALVCLNTAEKHLWRYAITMAVAAALSAYTHYFALLQVMVCGLAYAPLVQKVCWKWVGASVFAAVMLSLPHLGISLGHLSRGGIGVWLQPPKPDYWMELLGYTFHYSWWLPVALIIAVAVGWRTLKTQLLTYIWVMLAVCAALPYVVAYWYSQAVDALLHQGAVFFSLPFLLLLIAFFVRLKNAMMTLVVVLAMGLNTYTLIAQRDHYTLNYTSEYETSMRWLSELETPALVGMRADFVQLLFDKQIVPASSVHDVQPMLDSAVLQTYLDTLTAPTLFFAAEVGTDPEAFAIALDHFPCIEEVRYFHIGEAYLLSKACDSRVEIPVRQVERETLSPEQPYSRPLALAWSDLQPHTNTHFVLDYAGSPENALLVVDVVRNADNLWSGSDFRRTYNPQRQQQRAYSTLLNSEIHAENTAAVNAYAWLNGAGGVEVLSLRAYAVPANPNKYRLLKPHSPTALK